MPVKSRLGPILNKTPVLRAKEFGELGISRLQLLDFENLGGESKAGMGSGCAVGSKCAVISMGNRGATVKRVTSPEHKVNG